MPKTAVISVSQLTEEPYASVICYPQATREEMLPRLEELKTLGVEAVEFSGLIPASALYVLGKGHTGVVAVAHTRGGKLALKMLRTDTERESLENEAALLSMANEVGVGPRFAAATKHFILMQIISGGTIREWIAARPDGKTVKMVIADILEQCWRLDGIGLDHGELVTAPKHILVDRTDMPYIVDFETSSTGRYASNVTSVCNFLFLGNSEVRVAVEDIIGKRDMTELFRALKAYKDNKSRKDFENLLEQCLAER